MSEKYNGKKQLGGFRGSPNGGVGFGAVSRAKNFKKTLRIFMGYLKPYWNSFVFILILAIAGVLCSLVGPKILGNMTDAIVHGVSSGEGIDFGVIEKTGYVLIGLYFFSAVFSYLQGWVMSGVSQKITFDLRRDISLKISRLPLQYFDSHENGNSISLVTNDIETISQNLNQTLVQSIVSVVSLLGTLAIMIFISWQMTLIAVLILPLSMSLVRLILKKSQQYYIKQQDSLGRIDGHVEEMFSNHVIVKSFNGENGSVTKFNHINQELYESGWKAQFMSGLMYPLMHFVSNLGYVAVTLTGGYLAIIGKVSIGDIQAFLQYMNQFTQPITQAANIANVFQSTIAAAERIFEFLDEQEEKGEDTDSAILPKEISGSVEFKNVFFGYNSEESVIHDFNAKIEPKSNVAIVGPTGAGKTTIVNLLMRFYDVDRGVISIDGVDISRVKRQDVRNLFGMVLQDTWLFSGTVAENIAFGKPDATIEEIVAAAKDAHVDHFIRTLSHGYDTIIADSIDNISAGEKQLLTIARAILSDAPMLILDEATSSVDTRTEILIQSAMEKMTKGRTSFVIAHRLSTIKNADLILVMKNGNVIEQGRHEELLGRGEFYASLYNSQFMNTDK